MGKWKAVVITGCMAMAAYSGTAQACGGYDLVLNEIRAESNLCNYATYDMNGDGTEELIVLSGTCEADYQYTFYTLVSDGSIWRMGSISGGHSSLYESEGGDGIYIVSGQMGWEQIREVTMGTYVPVISEEILSDRENVTEYYENDNPIELRVW